VITGKQTEPIKSNKTKRAKGNKLRLGPNGGLKRRAIRDEVKVHAEKDKELLVEEPTGNGKSARPKAREPFGKRRGKAGGEGDLGEIQARDGGKKKRKKKTKK